MDQHALWRTLLVAVIITAGLTTSASQRDQRDTRSDTHEAEAQFRQLRMVDENGVVPPDALMRAKAQADALREPQRMSPDAAGISRTAWSWLGPSNLAGRVRAVAVHPTTSSTIFAGSPGGGIWKSTTSGASWAPVDDFMTNLSISSIVFQPGVPSTMYAGTGEGFYNFGRVRGAGVFKSTNSGVTWTQLASTASADFHYVNRLAISADGATLLAGTSVGLFRSVNGGSTWTKVLTPSTLAADILDVKFLAGSSTQAVASGFSRNAYYSANGGQTWALAGGLVPAGNFTRVEIGVATSSASVVYLSVDAGSAAPGEVWRSTDGGVSYAITPAKPDHLGTRGWYANAVWVDPSDANRVVVGGKMLAATNDGGASWVAQAPGVGLLKEIHAIVADSAYNPSSNRRVFVANDGGLFMTSDIAVSPFTSVAFASLNNGLGTTQVYGVAGNATSGLVIGGIQHSGTAVYTPSSGTRWTVPAGGDAGFVAVDPTDPNYFYGEYSYLGIHRNSSGGASSSSTIYGQSDALGRCKDAPYSLTDACNQAANVVAPFILDPNNANTLLAGGLSLWRTTDVKAPLTDTTGPPWSAIKPPDAVASNYISAIAVASGNSDLIWVGHNLNGAIYKTSNGTAITPSWTNMRTSALPNRFVARIAIHPANHNLVYVAFAGFAANNLWRTTDGGTSWASASGSGAATLPAAPIYSVVVHPTIPNWVYVGTEVGLFASTDGGATWSLPHDGPANVSVEDLAWSGSSLLAATHGRGVFTTAGCTYTLSKTSANIVNAGGGGSAIVTASGSSCTWTAVSDSSWLSVTGSATGNGTLTYTAAPNSSGPRTGIISVGFATLTVTQGSTQTMSLDRESLAFGSLNSGGSLHTGTSAQSVTVTFQGSPANWTATTSTPWLQLGNASGSGNGRFAVSVVGAGGLPASGLVSGSITVTAPGVAGSPQTIPVTLRLFTSAASSAPAFGSFDTPAAGSTTAGSVAVTGWALDDIEVTRVELWRDRAPGETTPVYTGAGPGNGKIFIANPLFISGARPDVEGAYGSVPLAHRGGWGYLMLTWGLWNRGNGPFTLYAFAYDREGRSSVLGSKTITVSNATATQPFGSIDTPAYGETVTSSLWNFGWALTPNSASNCAIGAAGVQVSIDSGPLMPVSYGDARADLQAGFPGFTNSGGAGGHFYLDTSTLTNGNHQIGWYVVDNCGRADGVGSRFFTVLNGASSTSTTEEATPAAMSTSTAAPSSVMATGRDVVNMPIELLAERRPVEIRRGLESTIAYPNPARTRVVPIAQGERVELQLPSIGGNAYAGYHVVNGERRALPAGSTLDAATGVFYWQPAAGFLGPYDLEFVTAEGRGVVRVRAIVGTSVLAVIDTPAAGQVPSSFVIAGWAIDEAAASGSGIDTIHVWAYPVGGGAPVFLGVAAHGDERPDIASMFGEQFSGSSYSLYVPHLNKGTYDVVVFPHSAVVGDFHGARVVRLTIP